MASSFFADFPGLRCCWLGVVKQIQGCNTSNECEFYYPFDGHPLGWDSCPPATKWCPILLSLSLSLSLSGGTIPTKKGERRALGDLAISGR